MILADSNIWCDFFRQGDPDLENLLGKDRILIHRLIIGELAMGNLPERTQTLRDLCQLTQIQEASWDEAFTLLEHHNLYGRGIQWNDLLILTSVLLRPDVEFWTRDIRLRTIAAEFGCALFQ